MIVAEGPGHWRNVEYLVEASGLGDVLRHYKVPFVDLNHDEPVKTPNLGRLTELEHLYLSRTIATADVVISLPKLKTHHWAGATLSLKNLFGTLPGICYGWPKNELHWRGIDNSIVDIALTRTPDLAIVDGIVGMEGDGPLNGTPKPMGVLIMGNDLVAVDATCCRLMKLDPEKVGVPGAGDAQEAGAAGGGGDPAARRDDRGAWRSRSRRCRTSTSSASNSRPDHPPSIPSWSVRPCDGTCGASFSLGRPVPLRGSSRLVVHWQLDWRAAGLVGPASRRSGSPGPAGRRSHQTHIPGAMDH